jgi:hypothetical protein
LRQGQTVAQIPQALHFSSIQKLLSMPGIRGKVHRLIQEKRMFLPEWSFFDRAPFPAGNGTGDAGDLLFRLAEPFLWAAAGPGPPQGM